jgi:hypothetical protein
LHAGSTVVGFRLACGMPAALCGLWGSGKGDRNSGGRCWGVHMRHGRASSQRTAAPCSIAASALGRAYMALT